MLKGTQRIGRPCRNCGGVIRYRSNGGCVVCLRSHNAKYQAANRDALLVKKREWAKRNPEKNAAQSIRWQSQNWDRAYQVQRTARLSRWDEHYRQKFRAYAAARRAALLLRTPPWADKTAIDHVYRDCPTGMEVDHIVPLMGRNVCGLHVHWNLQYLSKSENSSKGSRHE